MDRFDPARHRLKFKARLGSHFDKVAANIKLEKVMAKPKTPLLLAFKDIESGSGNETITPGRTAVIKGYRLKFDQDDANQGIFFIGTDAEYRARMVVSIKPKELIFVNPADLPPGNYKLEVRALQRRHRDIKRGRLNAILTA